MLKTVPITIKPASATINAPKTVKAGDAFSFSFEGPTGSQHYISLAKKGETKPNKYETYAWARTNDKVTLTAPSKPGAYQLVFVLQGAKKQRVLTRVPLVVEAR